MDTIEVSISAIQDALDAMEWTFNPYLDEPFTIRNYPYIVELIVSYNSIASLLPEPFQSLYPVITID